MFLALPHQVQLCHSLQPLRMHFGSGPRNVPASLLAPCHYYGAARLDLRLLEQPCPCVFVAHNPSLVIALPVAARQ
jgi:hypothetical protein